MEMLDRWIGWDTAYEHHPIDDANFYLFIGHVWKDCRDLWDESMAREILTRRAKEVHPDWDPNLITKIVETRKAEGTLILDFLCALKNSNKIRELIAVP
jgi:hypothetical protein